MRSKRPAAAVPTPKHIETTPYLPPRRPSSCKIWVVSFAPVQRSELPERYRSAVHVQAVFGDADLLSTIKSLTSKGLVDLAKVDIWTLQVYSIHDEVLALTRNIHRLVPPRPNDRLRDKERNLLTSRWPTGEHVRCDALASLGQGPGHRLAHDNERRQAHS